MSNNEVHLLVDTPYYTASNFPVLCVSFLNNYNAINIFILKQYINTF